MNVANCSCCQIHDPVSRSGGLYLPLIRSEGTDTITIIVPQVDAVVQCAAADLPDGGDFWLEEHDDVVSSTSRIPIGGHAGLVGQSRPTIVCAWTHGATVSIRNTLDNDPLDDPVDLRCKA